MKKIIAKDLLDIKAVFLRPNEPFTWASGIKSPIYCDNTSAINVFKNPVNHSRTKHIDIRHHFLRDHVNKETITLDFVNSENLIADIFTKPVCEATFINLQHNLGICALKDL